MVKLSAIHPESRQDKRRRSESEGAELGLAEQRAVQRVAIRVTIAKQEAKLHVRLEERSPDEACDYVDNVTREALLDNGLLTHTERQHFESEELRELDAELTRHPRRLRAQLRRLVLKDRRRLSGVRIGQRPDTKALAKCARDLALRGDVLIKVICKFGLRRAGLRPLLRPMGRRGRRGRSPRRRFRVSRQVTRAGPDDRPPPEPPPDGAIAGGCVT